MTPDRAIQRVTAAIDAVKEGIEASTDEAPMNQLQLALRALQGMVDDLTTGRIVDRDTSWLSQMVVDQWDFHSPLGETVLRAREAYSKAVAKRS